MNTEIAAEFDITEEAVRQITQDLADLPKLGKPDRAAADHATDFAVPIYNVWMPAATPKPAARVKLSEAARENSLDPAGPFRQDRCRKSRKA